MMHDDGELWRMMNGIIVGIILGHFEVILRSSRGSFWGRLGIILGWCRDDLTFSFKNVETCFCDMLPYYMYFLYADFESDTHVC